MRKLFVLAVLLLGLPLAGHSQATPTGGWNTFSLTAAPMSLPGNKQTVVGTEIGATLQITNSFAFRQSNIIAPASNFQFFGGGFNIYLPKISQKLQNASPTINGFKVQPYLTASAGAARVAQAAGTAQHYGFKAGAGFNYYMSASGTWAFGAEVEYAKFPGLQNNTWIVKLGPSIHW